MSSLQPPQHPACGGERALGSVAGGIIFLSRLRGSELGSEAITLSVGFLSRLRGGELPNQKPLSHHQFLSKAKY